MKEVSVVIPSFRGGSDLVKAVKTVQNDDNVLELLIVFNGPSADVNKSHFLNLNEGINYSIVSALSDKNIASAPKARNIGLRKSKGRYIHFLDDDDYVSSCFYEKALHSFKSFPDIVGVSLSAVVLSDTDGSIKSYAIRRFSRVDKQLLYVDNFVGVTSSVIIESSAARAVGGFDESMPARQDYLFWLNLSTQGDFLCLQDKELFWIEHSTTKSLSSRLDISKHKTALDKINKAKKKILDKNEVSILDKLKSKSNNYKYLASIAKRQGSNSFIYWGVISFMIFPNLAIISSFLPRRLVLFIKNVIYK